MKKLLIIIGVLIALVVVAAIVAPQFINADTVRRTLIAKVQEQTGRTLAIGGKLSITLFPVAGVHAEDVSLSNPPGFPDNAPMIALKALTVDVAVMPLLHGGVEVKDLVLDEPRINLHVAANGAQNWDFASKEKTAAPAPASNSSSSASLPQNISLNGVSIKNGSVSYVNDQTKQHQAVQKLDTDLSMGGLAEPFSIKGSGEWNGKIVKIDAKLGSLQGLLSRRADVTANVSSELLSIDAKGAVASETFTGKASVSSPSLKNLLAWANPASKPLATSSPLALSLKSDVECSEHNCNATNADLTLDKLTAKGSVKAALDGKPNIALDLTTGTLDFNPFLPPEHHAELLNPFISEAVAAGAPWSSDPIDLSALESVNATANIKADGILFRKFTIGKTTLHATLKDGRLTADVADAQMYDGKGSLSVALDAGGSVESKASLAGVQIGKLLKDAADLSKLSGAADVQFSASGHGRSQRDIVSSLAGNGQFKLNNGSISGVNLLDMLHNVGGAFSGGGSSKTPITAMNGTFTIAQGVISNKDLLMTMPSMQVAGQGTINLPAYVINYHLTPQVVREAGKGNATGAGLGVPVIVDGSLDNPSYHPDLNSLVQQAIKNPQQLKQQLKSTEGSLKDQLKGGGSGNLKDQLKGLKGLLGGQGN